MTSSKKLCVNCDKIATDNYCANCGQKQGINRLSWKSVFDELQKRLFGFDNNFLRTVKDLTIHPKRVITASIEGVRVKYIGPVGYYFLLITIYVIVINTFNIDLSNLSLQFNESLNPDLSQEQREMSIKANNFIAENFRLISFIMIPFFVGGLNIIFSNKGYNFLETSVITLYGQAHPIWFSIVFLLINKYTGNALPIMVMTFVSFLYTIIVATFFYTGNKLWNFLKASVAMILGFVLLIVVSVLIGVIIGMLKSTGLF